MSVKWSIIKALTCFLLVCSSTGYAQEASTITIEPRRVFRDTVIITKHDTVWLEKEKVKIDSADISNKRLNPEKPDVPLNKNDAFQKVQKRRVQEKR